MTKTKTRRQRLPLKTLIAETKNMILFTEASIWKNNNFGQYLYSKMKIKPFELPLGRKEISEWYMVKNKEVAFKLKQAGSFIVETKDDLPYSLYFLLRFSDKEDLLLDFGISQYILQEMAIKFERTPYELSVRLKEELQDANDRKALRPDWVLAVLQKQED